MPCQLLHRINPDLNMARFCRVELTPDLFGRVIVERRWGRIGSRGQHRLESFADLAKAEQRAALILTAKGRRSYGPPAIPSHLRN